MTPYSYMLMVQYLMGRTQLAMFIPSFKIKLEVWVLISYSYAIPKCLLLGQPIDLTLYFQNYIQSYPSLFFYFKLFINIA